ncbi:hypothetical protein SKAU_G00138170 [Synaphobranchus kaupii]|uniref:Uncharacterized protein n=1 Tax=Synaphobranchus kaupii TaxID=118154 RepID=A0A9Q1J3Q7_SYNKA|nr:hypothetical protein SKAU_G00138170 [Synaphobranchus kaupii]
MTAIWQGNLKGLKKGNVSTALYLDPFGALPAAIEKCKNATRDDYLRCEIASILLSYKDDMTDLCVACGEFTSKRARNVQLDEWIEWTRQDCGR